MIRLRTTRGDILPVSETSRFVELCDLDGRVAKVFYRDERGVINEVTAGSPEAERYARMMRVTFIPLTAQS